MEKLLILISAACLLLPVMAFGAGNVAPRLYLEIYDNDAMCICPGHPLNCFRADKGPSMHGYVFVHIGCVENGYYGLPFGMTTTGTASFMNCTACPGFLKGPSTAGEPAAIIVSSTELCHPWNDHLCYCMWLSMDVNKEYFDIVASADLGHYKVINCDNEYDEGTLIGNAYIPTAHAAQWGGVQDIICYGGPTAVELTTWGKIKGLYR